MKKIDVKKIALADIESEKRDIYLYETVCKVMAPFEGKKLTRREHDKIIAALSAYGFTRLRIYAEYSWTKLELVDPSHPSAYRRTNPVDFMFYYEHERAQGFSLETFAKRNTWASEGAPERLEKNLKALENGTVEKLQEAYDLLAQAQEKLSQFSGYYVPFLYDLENAFGYELREKRK